MGNAGSSIMLAEHSKEVTLPVQTILLTTATQEKELPRLKIQHTEADISGRGQNGRGHSRLSSK